jgi:hypothetical protein
MRVSQHYKLGRTQPTLDFVDVDVDGDTRVFVDPRAIRMLQSEWSEDCTALVRNFFEHVLSLIRRGLNGKARALLSTLREPNETHLGMSKGRARGRALGSGSAREVWEALSTSDAARTGLLEDLEDTILMIEGVNADIVSDITTNIIREPLILYTQQKSRYYGIPLVPDVVSGPVWNPETKTFESRYVDLPVTPSGKLLLVPKAIVRQRMDYDAGEYYRHYLLEHLQSVELRANTELVHLLKNGSTRVHKKDLIKKYGSGKHAIVEQTKRYPQVLKRYRDSKKSRVNRPMDHLTLAASERTRPPDWDRLLLDLKEVPAGRADAPGYEKAAESLLSALFYPSLADPHVHTPIHNGRKRIDITYANIATDGFFRWLSLHHHSGHLFIECKNYVGDPGNPELDQLSGRFSAQRGRVGLLVCRQFSDKALFLQRCRDTASDDRGFVIALDDDDVEALVNEKKNGFGEEGYGLLMERFEALVL